MTADTPHDLGLTEVVLRPVRGHHAFEACVEQLGTLIRLGVYPLGTTLPSERVLADRLHVSQATLREAMAALREAGLVETRRGRGGGTVVTMRPRTPSARRAARITPAQRADWADALEFRGLVEPSAAHLAAPTASATRPPAVATPPPTRRLTTLPTATPYPARSGCDPAYPEARTCIPPGPPWDQGCAITAERRFTVRPPDPQGLDHDGDGIGCEPIA